MVWDIIKFALKLTVVMIVVVVFGFMGMTLIIGSGVATVYQLLVGAVFVVFTLALVWDNATRWGEKDLNATLNLRKQAGTEKQLKQYSGMKYFPAKGFIAGAIAMLIPLALTVIYIILTYNGWEKYVPPQLPSIPDLIYNILVIIFMPYSGLLRLATPTLIRLNYTAIGMPFVILYENAFIAVGQIRQPNMIMPYMFLVPIIIFIAVAGISYIMGYKARMNLLPPHTKREYFGTEPEKAEQSKGREDKE